MQADAAEIHQLLPDEPVELSSADREEALERVVEIQQTRAGAEMRRVDVPHILLPYQARWHADDAVVRLAEKSRRIGWSWSALAAEGALEAARAGNAGMDQFYMGYNRDMAAEQIGDVVYFARAFGHAVGRIEVSRHRDRALLREPGADDTHLVVTDITTYAVRFASGRKYEALSSNPNNWRGRQGHARIDEAAFHPNLAMVVKAALAFRLWGGRISVVSTHNGEDNQFNLWCRDIRAGTLNWSLHHVDFDGALADGFYRRICLVRGIEWTPEGEAKFRADAFADYPDQADANEELLCIPKRGSGAYFSRIIIEQCQADDIPVIRWQQPPEWVLSASRIEETRAWLLDNVRPVIDTIPAGQRTAYGQDFGRDGDLSVIWILRNDAPDHWTTVMVIELRKIPFDAQAAIRDYLLDHLPLLHAAKFDARGNGQSHAEGAMQGHPGIVECVQLTQSWYAEQFPRYRRAYEDRSITVPKSEDIIADHRLVELHRGLPRMADRRTRGSDGQPRHGDSTVAGLMAWAAANDSGEPAHDVSIDRDPDDYRPRAWRLRRSARLYSTRRGGAI